MSLLLLLSIGCSNVLPGDWGGSGARYASGYASDLGDTAGDDTGGGDGNAPELLTGAAEYQENDLGQLYIIAGVAYEDEPDDVEGGRLYYELLADGETVEQGARDCVADDPDYATQAAIANGNLTFAVGPVDQGVAHTLLVYVNDLTHNTSNELQVEVTGG